MPARVLVNRPTNTHTSSSENALSNNTHIHTHAQRTQADRPYDRRRCLAGSAVASGMDNPQQQNGDKPDVEVSQGSGKGTTADIGSTCLCSEPDSLNIVHNLKLIEWLSDWWSDSSVCVCVLMVACFRHTYSRSKHTYTQTHTSTHNLANTYAVVFCSHLAFYYLLRTECPKSSGTFCTANVGTLVGHTVCVRMCACIRCECM